MKNAYDGLINRLDIAEERISDLEEMLVETSQTEIQYVKQIKKQTGEKRKQTGQNIQELWNNYQRCNLCIMGIRRREKRTEEIFEAIMTKSFQN